MGPAYKLFLTQFVHVFLQKMTIVALLKATKAPIYGLVLNHIQPVILQTHSFDGIQTVGPGWNGQSQMFPIRQLQLMSEIVRGNIYTFELN